MAKYIPPYYLNWLLDRIKESTHVAVCSEQPTNFYHGYWSVLRYTNTLYAVGDIVRPSTNNGFVYECTVGGLTGANEPVWSVVQDATFTDNEVTWVAKRTYSLVLVGLNELDWEVDVQAAATLLTFLGRNQVTSHEVGVVGHTAFICLTDKTLRYVTTASTDDQETNEIQLGRLVNINPVYIERSNLL